MSFQAPTAGEKARTAAGAASRTEAAPRIDALQPLLAGAHARGMADALELAGVAAVMIDAQGMVLHVGATARDLFGAHLRVDYDHLVASTSESTRAIQTLIAGALADGESQAPILVARAGLTPLKLHARIVPGSAGNVCQLLKILILIEETAPRPTGN